MVTITVSKKGNGSKTKVADEELDLIKQFEQSLEDIKKGNITRVA